MTNFEFLKASIAEHGMRDECLIWPKGLNTWGYPELKDGSKQMTTGNRVVCEIVYGPPPPRALALHGPCNNRACYAPAHLRWGTSQENMDDKIRDGTLARGERHGSRTKPESRPRGERIACAVLTEKDVIELRRARASGELKESLRQLGARYGVSNVAIGKAINGKTWKHLLVETS